MASRAKTIPLPCTKHGVLFWLTLEKNLRTESGPQGPCAKGRAECRRTSADAADRAELELPKGPSDGGGSRETSSEQGRGPAGETLSNG